MLRKLASQTAVYGISTIIAKLLNYMLTPYLTRVMSLGEYGVITDLYALIPFVMVLLTMGLETGYFRFAGAAESLQDKRTVFSTTWGTLTLMALLFMAGAWLFTPQIAAVMEYSSTPSYIWLVAAIIALDVIAAIPFARLRQEDRRMRYVVIRTLSVVVTIVFTVLFYSFLPRMAEGGGVWSALYIPNYGAGYALIANLISSLVTLVVLFPVYRDVVPRIKWSLLRTILIYSFPLLMGGIAGTANQFIDRQLIKYLMPGDDAMAALGMYGAIAKIGVILLLFTQMYRLAAEPFFLANFKKDDFKKTNAEALKYFVIASLAMYLIITLFSDLFALVLVGPEYREGIYILPILLLANIFSGITFNLNLWYKQTGDTKYAIVVTGLGLVVTIAIGVAMIPRFGIIGAAWTRFGCEAVMLVISYYLNNRYFPTPYNLKRIAEYTLVAGVIYATTFLTADWHWFVQYSVNLLFLILFAFFVVRKEHIDIKSIIGSLRRKL